MFVDDARLWACSGGANPPPLPVAVPLPAPMEAPPPVVVVPFEAASVVVVPVAPAPAVAARGGRHRAGDRGRAAASTPSANITRVAVTQPTQMFAGTAVAPRTEVLDTASSWLSRIRLQEVLRWFLIASAIVGIFLVLLWLLRKLFGGPTIVIP